MGKDKSIETLRGIAILLMVSGHVIGNTAGNGLCVNNDSFFRYCYYTFEHLRMPLFTVISGFVYSLRPVSHGKINTFLEGKARRILLPMIFAGSAQYLLRCIIPNINKPADICNIWKIFIYGFDQFWFLQSIFLIFALIALLERIKMLETFHRYLLVFILAFALFYLIPKSIPVFSINGSQYLLPFFLLGIGLNRFHEYLSGKYIKISCMVIFVAGMTIQQLLWFDIITGIDNGRYSILSFLVGISGTALLFYYRKENKILTRLGHYSYSIYLFHVLGTAFGRMIMTKMGFYSPGFLVFLVSLSLGLFIPVIIKKILIRNSYLKLLFLGLRPDKLSHNNLKPVLYKLPKHA